MKHLMLVLMVASVYLAEKRAEPARQATLKDLNLAFPMPDNARPGGDEDQPLQHIPGSKSTYTEEQINPFNPPDWFPDEHPAMPEVVRHGRGGPVQACSYCHLASGFGHPQSANLTGLSVNI